MQGGLEAGVVQQLGPQGQLAGSLHLRSRDLAGEAQDAQAGTEGLFGTAPGSDDRLDELGGLWPDLFRPVQDPFTAPFGGLLMFGWHVGGLG